MVVVVGSRELLLEDLRRNAMAFHIRDDLARDLLQDFLVESAAGHACIELDKLDNITRGQPTFRVAKTGFISIEFLHHLEVSVADTHDNYGAGKLGQLADYVLGLFHIVNCSISE